MTQADLFSSNEDQWKSLLLPPIIFGPIREKIGMVECLLRDEKQVQAKFLGNINVSQKIQEPVFETDDGERIVVTSRNKIERPDEVDGVLIEDSTGFMRWMSHRLIEEFETSGQAGGWPNFVASRANNWENSVSFKAEKPEEDGSVVLGNEGLRPPQLGALHAIGAHWSLNQHHATIVMPTGTGKTETMLAALAAYIRSPLIVVVPSDALRLQTVRKFRNFGLLRQLGILEIDAPNPIVGMVTKVPRTVDDLAIFDRCNVIVSTMSSLGAKNAQPLADEIAKRVGFLVMDEAHHVSARTWTRFREAFRNKPVLQFTATPFRRDSQVVDGEVIYSYPLRKAREDHYFKAISFEPVYEPNSTQSDVEIARQAVQQLRQDLDSGFNHLLMARCDSTDRAEEVARIYEDIAPDLKPVVIHSKQNDAQARVSRLIAGEHRIAVCVNMLGEGFDLPQLKVAAVHDLHKSLAILLQFVGRFTRTAGLDLGDATIVANIAEPGVNAALERLYSEDADWNELLSEMSSDAAKDHARLTAFLQDTQRLDSLDSEDETEISHKLLRPTLSTLTFKASSFRPRRFHEGLPKELVPQRVWLNEKTGTLFFVTLSEPHIKWTRSKSLRDKEWALFVLHFDPERELLFLGSSDHSSTFENLAKAVGASELVRGEEIFRSLGNVARLMFQNVGVRKHGRRNLSYAMYTGANVAEALGMTEKANAVKSNLSATGWENGQQITIGCSLKGRVWSREKGSLLQFNDWCENVGSKLIDTSIDTATIIENVHIPTAIEELPDVEPLSIEWPVELLQQAEERILFSDGSRVSNAALCDLEIVSMNRNESAIIFRLVRADGESWADFRLKLDPARAYVVEQISGASINFEIGKLRGRLDGYFSDYPPLIRFVDLTELDGHLHIAPQTPQEFSLSEDAFEAWEWEGVDIKKESYWKAGQAREDSVQWYAARQFIDAEFDIVFDDDAKGEAADLVCIKIEDDLIRVAFVHCKYSGAATPGERVKDVVEVSSQAIRSAKWNGKIPKLIQHIRTREETLTGKDRKTRFIAGSLSDLNQVVKINRLKPMRSDILVVQPGIMRTKRTAEQDTVLAAASTFLKETVNVDLRIVCSES